MAGKNRASTTNQRIPVVIVEDHPVMREGLAHLINHEKDMAVCAEAESVNEALKAIEETRPRIAIVDIALKDSNGLDLIKDIRQRYPGLAVLVYSMFDESLYAERALRAGARGYIMKHDAAQNVVLAIRHILGGHLYLSPTMAERMLSGMMETKMDDRRSFIERLSNRELEIFKLIGLGFSRQQVAGKLHLSVHTVETHRANILLKLKLKDASELRRHAIEWTTVEAGR